MASQYIRPASISWANKGYTYFFLLICGLYLAFADQSLSLYPSPSVAFVSFCFRISSSNLKLTFLNTQRSSTNIRICYHFQSGKKNGILRVTTEEEGYAINSAKSVLRKRKKDVEENGIDEFDISSLTALSDVDLSCADEVLRETYDNFSKYSTENGESPDSLNSILEPVNNIIDHVLQGTQRSRMKSQQLEDKYVMIGNESGPAVAMGVPNTNNYRGAACRQYLAATSLDLGADPYSKIDNQFANSSSFDNAGNILCDADGFNRHYNTMPSLQDMQVDDETSFSYAKWLNEIL